MAPTKCHPLPASYVKKVHADAKRAVGSVERRSAWGDSRSGSPVVTMWLCEEIARLNRELESLKEK